MNVDRIQKKMICHDSREDVWIDAAEFDFEAETRAQFTMTRKIFALLFI